ncbi:hypothetical protein [Cylindrospermum sp. FACHB-282]|uniref:hypothetical protein n=1 Tax=Cylindrospermum sp. FACHB-282 TaxID=2692794 RepID=UPI001682E3CE|nr:hypothetical protein [Cylindrospermum sp. FACHB-282]MBD2386019.1 hypothetical protein [Cylindrospermum sp. FACHB-282]
MNTIQQSLFGESQEELQGDDRQTPNEIAKLIGAKLIKTTDETILCPAAGTGQIVKFLPTTRKIVCCEINHNRYLTGITNTAHIANCHWIHGNFFQVYCGFPEFEPIVNNKFDLVIDNPPFSNALDFIQTSLELLNPNNPEARVCFLLPGDYFYGKQRRMKLKSLDCHIHHIYPTGVGDGRIAYLDVSGKPEKGRQVYDVVFDIRLRRNGGVISYLFDL